MHSVIGWFFIYLYWFILIALWWLSLTYHKWDQCIIKTNSDTFISLLNGKDIKYTLSCWDGMGIVVIYICMSSISNFSLSGQLVKDGFTKYHQIWPACVSHQVSDKYWVWVTLTYIFKIIWAVKHRYWPLYACPHNTQENDSVINSGQFMLVRIIRKKNDSVDIPGMSLNLHRLCIRRNLIGGYKDLVKVTPPMWKFCISQMNIK